MTPDFTQWIAQDGHEEMASWHVGQEVTIWVSFEAPQTMVHEVTSRFEVEKILDNILHQAGADARAEQAGIFEAAFVVVRSLFELDDPRLNLHEVVVLRYKDHECVLMRTPDDDGWVYGFGNMSEISLPQP